ncbi:MAG: LysR family transcriptional regulator [Alteromonadaceae bacterium]|nr:MAG: LysR family transcriptional regulator [Alteromonadaceae bacterium]
MDIDALKAFIAVSKTQSFSLAAQQLFITQPAVSKRISGLEAHLNHSLFDRLGKTVRLTEAGATLLPKALSIVQQISETERGIRELSGEIRGLLKVATSHHIGLHHLPPVLREFASAHPDVNLQFEFLDSEKAHRKLLSSEVELAIVTLAPQLEPPLKAKQLWHDPLAFVVARDHPLASIELVHLSQLSEYSAILPDLNTYTGRLVKQCFDEQGLPLTLNMATNYLETIKMMVGVGLGWSVLPKTLIDEHMQQMHIPNIALARSLGVITHTKHTLSNAAQAFYLALTEAGN